MDPRLSLIAKPEARTGARVGQLFELENGAVFCRISVGACFVRFFSLFVHDASVGTTITLAVA